MRGARPLGEGLRRGRRRRECRPWITGRPFLASDHGDRGLRGNHHRRRCRQLADGRTQILPVPVGDHGLHLPLATVLRFREHGHVVVEHVPQAADRGHAHGAFGHELEDERKAEGHAGRLHTVVGRVIGKEQDVPAVLVERSITLGQVAAARVELREMGDEVGGSLALAGGEELQPFEEVLIRQKGRGAQHVFVHGPV